MKKTLIPALLAVCAVVSILSPWSGEALAHVDRVSEANTAASFSNSQKQPAFAFSRGGYRHAMPTWQH